MRHLKFNYAAYISRLRREDEIARYGKQVSHRCSQAHKSKKDYNRKTNKIKVYEALQDL